MVRRTYGTEDARILATFRPKTSSCPAVGSSAQKTSRSRVDFPAPDGPVRKTNSPLRISRLTSDSAGASVPYCFSTWKSWIIGPLPRHRPPAPSSPDR